MHSILLFGYILYFIFNVIQNSAQDFNARDFQSQIVRLSQFTQKVAWDKNDSPKTNGICPIQFAKWEENQSTNKLNFRVQYENLSKLEVLTNSIGFRLHFHDDLPHLHLCCNG